MQHEDHDEPVTCFGCGTTAPSALAAVHAEWLQLHRLTLDADGPRFAHFHDWPCLRRWLDRLDTEGVPTHATADALHGA